MVVARGRGVGEMGIRWQRVYTCSYEVYMLWGLSYSMVAIVNNIVSWTWKLLKE